MVLLWHSFLSFLLTGKYNSGTNKTTRFHYTFLLDPASFVHILCMIFLSSAMHITIMIFSRVYIYILLPQDILLMTQQ